jgi:transcriptional regulator with XRE-family HTH domain
MKEKLKEPKTIGARIRSIRGDLSQAEFADRVRIKQAMISRYEADKEVPSSKVLLRIAQYGGSSMEWILTGRFTTSAHRASKSGFISLDERIDLAVKAIKQIKAPESEDFISMMKDLFENRTRMQRVLEFYGFERTQKLRAGG